MKNFTAVESLRGWMAWWVVIGHALHIVGGKDYLPSPMYKLLSNGDAAVNVFIIISGFVISHLLISKDERYLVYIMRRGFRLFPVYYVCLGIAILVDQLYISTYSTPWAYGAEGRIIRHDLQWHNFWSYFLGHLTMLHGMIPDTILPYSNTAFLAPAWSLSLEWQFYLVAPLLIGALYRKRNEAGNKFILPVFLCLSAFVFFKAIDFAQWSHPSFLPLALNYFLVGILSRLVVHELEQRTATRSPRLFEASFLGIGILMICGMIEGIIWLTFLLIILAESELIEKPVPTSFIGLAIKIVAWNPFIQRIGRWSYSTYLVHIPIFAVFVGSGRIFFNLSSQKDALILIALAMPLVMVASYILYFTVESPGINLGKKCIQVVTRA